MFELERKHDEARRQISSLEQTNRSLLSTKGARLGELATLQNQERALISEIEDLKGAKYRAILKSTDPEDIHITKHLIHEKRCPYCDANLAPEISKREEEHLCFLCGNKIGSPEAKGIPELNLQISSKEQELRLNLESVKTLISQLSAADEELATLDEEIKQTLLKDKEYSQQLEGLSQVNQYRIRANLVDENLKAIVERLRTDSLEYERLENSTTSLKNEVTEIENLQRKGEELAKTRSREIFNAVSSKFSEFSRLATNGEMEARLGDDMIPTLQGRSIYSVEDASQFERTILDVGFRIALLSTIAEIANSTPFLVLETPDETADESYVNHLAKALTKVSPNISLLITSSNTDFTKTLLSSLPELERKNRFLDLSGVGTSTQKSYYTPMISQWLK